MSVAYPIINERNDQDNAILDLRFGEATAKNQANRVILAPVGLSNRGVGAGGGI